MARVITGVDAGRSLVRTHLLLLPEDLPPELVVGLVRARHPDLVATVDGAWRLGRWTTLTGPLHLDADAATAAGVPAPWSVAWAVACPVEREGPPPFGLPDREGLSRAFADGLPVRAERRAVDLALALARRLSGAVRVSPSGVVLVPDPQAWIDQVVHSPYWLSPEQALATASAAVPGAALAMEGQPWQGPRAEALAALEAPGAGAGLEPRAREQLHRAADVVDAAAVAGEDLLDAYALVVDRGVDGVVEVRVSGAPDVPPALAGLDWAGAAVTYEVLWWPADEGDAEAEHPGPAHLAARERARGVVDALAQAVLTAVGGVRLDADGLPLGPLG